MDPSPVTVFVNAEVFSAEGATSVAVENGRIAAVSRNSLAEDAGAGARIIDAGGATLLPGFTDAHVHPLLAGVQRLTCDLSGQPHSVAAYARVIRDYADSNPDVQWLSGNGWYGDTFPGGLPTRDDLDSVVPDRPVVIISHDGHGVWVNSRALELAGIGDRTPDPAGGHINRDPSGRATGVLVERAGDLVTSLLPALTQEVAEAALLEAQSHLHSLGVTAWQDACVGPLLGMPDPLPVYERLVADERLTARVVGALWWDAKEGLDQLEVLEERRRVGRSARFTASAVKVMQDGVCENCTGAMLAPYSGNPQHGSTTGLSFIDPEELRLVCRELDRRDFRIHMHAVGDRAVRECLDALESAQERAGRGLRHQIAHLDVVDEQDVPRFAQLGVIANIQALWARRDKEIIERKLPLLGPDREHRHFPFADLHRTGATLAMGSDWPVTDPNPLWAIYTAVHRLAPPEDPHGTGEEAQTEPLLAEQGLDLHTALRAYTAGSAVANGMGTETGTVEVGRYADLVLLDRAILSGDGLSAALPRLTMIEGKDVFER